MGLLRSRKPSRRVASEKAKKAAKASAKPTLWRGDGTSENIATAARVVQSGPVARIGAMTVTGRVRSAKYASDQLVATIRDFAASRSISRGARARAEPKRPAAASAAAVLRNPVALVTSNTANGRFPETLCFLQTS